MTKCETKMIPLAYANLDIAKDDPDAFDIESVSLYAMIVDTYPKIYCFAVERKCTECDHMCYSLVYNSFTEASDVFKKILNDHGTEKVAIANDIYDYFDDDEPYTRSSTYGDYGPSNPWDAPGMSVSDFIRGVV